jgi:hypothetical protein
VPWPEVTLKVNQHDYEGDVLKLKSTLGIISASVLLPIGVFKISFETMKDCGQVSRASGSIRAIWHFSSQPLHPVG